MKFTINLNENNHEEVPKEIIERARRAAASSKTPIMVIFKDGKYATVSEEDFRDHDNLVLVVNPDGSLIESYNEPGPNSSWKMPEPSPVTKKPRVSDYSMAWFPTMAKDPKIKSWIADAYNKNGKFKRIQGFDRDKVEQQAKAYTMTESIETEATRVNGVLFAEQAEIKLEKLGIEWNDKEVSPAGIQFLQNGSCVASWSSSERCLKLQEELEEVTKTSKQVLRESKKSLINTIREIAKGQKTGRLITEETQQRIPLSPEKAKKILKVYSEMNEQNRKRLVEMLSYNQESFDRTMSFIVETTKG